MNPPPTEPPELTLVADFRSNLSAIRGGLAQPFRFVKTYPAVACRWRGCMRCSLGSSVCDVGYHPGYVTETSSNETYVCMDYMQRIPEKNRSLLIRPPTVMAFLPRSPKHMLMHHDCMTRPCLMSTTVHVCRKRGEEAGVSNLRAGVEDGQTLSGFQDCCVDAVTCTWGLESMPDGKKAISVRALIY